MSDLPCFRVCVGVSPILFPCVSVSDPSCSRVCRCPTRPVRVCQCLICPVPVYVGVKPVLFPVCRCLVRLIPCISVSDVLFRVYRCLTVLSCSRVSVSARVCQCLTRPVPVCVGVSSVLFSYTSVSDPSCCACRCLTILLACVSVQWRRNYFYWGGSLDLVRRSPYTVVPPPHTHTFFQRI